MSITRDRKVRQKLERENLILENAARLLARDGFQNLNLDELASSIEYSKGTLYLHFKTKEDLVLSVATLSLKHRADLLERAVSFSDSTRERARAMGFACCEFAVTHREFFAVTLMLQEISFWDRVSKDRQDQHLLVTQRTYDVVHRLVLDAKKCGDLPGKVSARDVTLSLMAITMGSHCIVTQPQLQTLYDIREPMPMLLMHQDRMMDGWGWKPISNGNRHVGLDRRIRRELFPNATWLKT